MARIGVYSETDGHVFTVFVPGLDVPAERGWTKAEALGLFLPALRAMVYRMRQQGLPDPRGGLDAVPPGVRGELDFFAI